MKYNCAVCNYSTEYSSNWTNHKKTKSHQKKSQENDILKTQQIDGTLPGELPGTLPSNDIAIASNESKLICPYCSKSFATKPSLSRHKNHRCSKNVDNKINKCEKQDPELVASLRDEVTHLRSMLNQAGKITSDAITTAKSSTSALNYIAQTFTNAPLLEPLKDYSTIKDVPIIKNYRGNNDLAIALITLYKDGTLVHYLGNLLLSIYKKDDPKQQSLWNSDCARLSYIIRTIVGNKPSWIVDKKGVQLKEFMVNPLLEYIEEEIWEFMKDPNNGKIENINKMQNATELFQDLRNFEIGEELIKFLAPHFQISKTK